MCSRMLRLSLCRSLGSELYARHARRLSVSIRLCATSSSSSGVGKPASSIDTHATHAHQANRRDNSHAKSSAAAADELVNVHDSALKARQKGFIDVSDDIVMETARKALAREGRDEEPEAQIWRWETTGVPILAQGKQNVYDHTDDIPQHVKPFWHHEYYQQREYFRLQREKRPLRERIRLWSGVCLFFAMCGTVLTLFRVWVEQPRQVHRMREEILHNAYGRVLELSAGHGQNIGAYPYAVHEVVMTDSNAQQLQALSYRIPNTAYPKYDIRRVRSESLSEFADGEFDCVVDMFGLCHLHDPVMALRQMQRVVKPSGMILLLEHGASPYMPVNWFLDYFQRRHEINTHGCRWNLPIRDYLHESRLEIKEMRNLHYGTTYYVVAYPEVLNSLNTDTAATVKKMTVK